jgi:photosystem II stability/assembly factor-like uncharacterized protein
MFYFINKLKDEKMKYFIILFLFLLITAPIIYPQPWQKQTVSVPSNAFVGPFSSVNENVNWATWSTSWNSSTQFKNGFLRTTDGGETWSGGEIPETENGIILWIEALDANTAFIAVENYAAPGIQGIYKTTDGGINWSKNPNAYAGQDYGPGYIHFFDNNNGVTVGEQNTGAGFEIFTTTNGGTDWNEVPQSDIPHLYAEELIQTTPMGEYGNCVWLTSFPSPGHGPRIFKTTDKGYHWSALEPAGLNDTQIISVAFENDNTGIMVVTSTRNAVIKKTTDGGITWSIINRPYGCDPDFISYISSTDSCYVITGDANFSGRNGGSAYTTNGGATWTVLDSADYIEPYFVSPTVGWSSHWGSNYVYKFTDNTIFTPHIKVTSVLDKTNTGKVNSYLLEQNYPNPFNPFTTIRYSIKGRTNVKITILNSIGEEISTILNEEKEPGEYQVNFNASSLASGVYFYRIKAGEFTSVKKMILMK